MIRAATEADLPGIMAIVALVVSEMRSEGNDQWDELYPARADFLADAGRGELYVDADEDGPVAVRAVACLNRVEPAEYRSIRWSSQGGSTVIHRLAVHPECRGLGIAKALFGRAEELALENGTGCIRSDTYSLNARMNALFARMGYRRAGTIFFMGRREAFYCYEKVVGG